ncbi:MAG: GIY-YIG nuclease family protein [Candidatus Bathyarchaeota archaeon]|nr:MAG: GIY-YIG nuclease family protein [Candidatus Bathyarchaeota archaeon]
MQTSPFNSNIRVHQKTRSQVHISDLSQRGSYILILDIKEQTQVKFRVLREQTFCPGRYAYTGSALGIYSTNLSHRLLRHLKGNKKKHWHIDHLLSHPNVRIAGIIAILSDQRLECKINQFIESNLGGAILVSGFGSSDCSHCRSHLLLLRNDVQTRTLLTKLRVFMPTVTVIEVAF